MSESVTLSWTAVAGVFIFGVVVGWLIAKHLRVGVSAKIGMSGDQESPHASGFVHKTVTRKFILKCQCGAVWNFVDGNGPVPPGSEPLPSGESFSCPKCGRSIDLKAAREAEREALAKLS